MDIKQIKERAQMHDGLHGRISKMIPKKLMVDKKPKRNKKRIKKLKDMTPLEMKDIANELINNPEHFSETQLKQLHKQILLFNASDNK